jgi:uncharacterized membrane protein/protein-disulfide isomerase
LFDELKEPLVSKQRYVLLIATALIGFLLSLLSLYQFVSLPLGADHRSSFCSISEHVNCAKVHLSSWSSVFGFPLASYGLGFYLLLIVISVLGYRSRLLKNNEARDFICLSSFLASLSSLALFYISEFIIGALCPVCIGMYLTNFTLFALSYFSSAQETLFDRIKAAFQAGIRLLSIWVPTKNNGEFLVRFGTLLFLCIALSFVFTGEILMKLYYLGQNGDGGELTEEKKRNIIAPMIAEWEGEPVITINVSRGQVLTSDFTKGSDKAAIQIIEFSDFGCPHCQMLGRALTKLIKEFPTAIEVIHKDFPLDSSCNKYSPQIHIGSCKAAEFARCAGEQDKFWAVAEMYFESGFPDAEDEKTVQEKLLKESESLGLDSEALQECLTSARQLEKIKGDTALGEALKLQATPSVWINGKYLRTPHPDVVRAIVEKLLLQSK